jgi:hypothetical protein
MFHFFFRTYAPELDDQLRNAHDLQNILEDQWILSCLPGLGMRDPIAASHGHSDAT